MAFYAIYMLVGVMGACCGSFANVAALRTLEKRNWVSAPSSCFSCQRRLTFFENLPIVGYLRWGGRCQCGKQRLPVRYVLVELAMAGLLILALTQLGWAQMLTMIPFLVLLAVIFLTDMDAFLIPDWASLGGGIFGLVLALFEAPGLPDIKTAMIGALAGFVLLYTINLTYRLLRGRDGIGFGDVKLMAMLGVWLGPLSLLPILFSASIVGAVLGIVLIVSHRNKKNAMGTHMLPFGCFLVPMALLWLFFAPFALRAIN